MTHGSGCGNPRELDGAVLGARMIVVVGWQRISGHHRHTVELQTVQHHTGIGVALTGLQLGSIGNNYRLTVSDVERDERRAGLQRALGGRGKLLTRSHLSAVHANVDVRLHLVLVGIVVIGLQRMLTRCQTRNSQDERRRGIGNLCHIAILEVCCHHFVGNHAQALGLHVGLAPVAAHG